MTRENTTNFATTTLAVAINSGSMSFTVATGTGALFPTVSTPPTAGAFAALPYYARGFIVCIDSELMLCSARSTDTFTVMTRGYESTTPVSHAIGATVSLAMTSGMLARLWNADADTFNMNVPFFDRLTNPIGPSGWDDEFDFLQTKWSMYPAPPLFGGTDSGVNADINTTYRSCFQVYRNPNNSTIYYIWEPFSPGSSAFTIYAKIAHSCSTMIGSRLPTATLFISDQTNPSVGPDAGNMVRLESVIGANSITIGARPLPDYNVVTLNTWVAAQSTSGVYGAVSAILNMGEQFWRLQYLGNGNWTYAVSPDGSTWNVFGGLSKTVSNIATMGFRFYITGAGNDESYQWMNIDWVRVTMP